jgi:hypothetical protein
MPFEDCDLKQLIVRGLVEWVIWKITQESGWLPYPALPMDKVFGDSEGGFEAFGNRLDAYLQRSRHGHSSGCRLRSGVIRR